MAGPHEVDPCGDIIINLCNPGAPFAEVPIKTELAVAESPAIEESPAEAPAEELPGAASEDWLEWEFSSLKKSKKDKKKRKKLKAKLVIEVEAIENAFEAESAAAHEAAFADDISPEKASVISADAATEKESVVQAELGTNLDGLLGDGYEKHEKDRPLSDLEIQFRVSSRHLILASPYFKVALNGPWTEAAPVSAVYPRNICTEDWDPEAFLILMHIIHGRNRQVPRFISLELLAKIAVLVDYYKCYEAVEVFTEIWLQQLKSQSQLPEEVNRELTLWLCVSWIFNDTKVFTSVTSTALQQSQGLLPTFGLPIPEIIVAVIDSRRQDVIDNIITTLYELLVSLRDDPNKCSFECCSIRLGALTKEMHAKGLEPRPESLMRDYSAVAIMNAARSIRIPSVHANYCSRGYYCNLGVTIQSKLDSLKPMMSGLTLDEFAGCR